MTDTVAVLDPDVTVNAMMAREPRTIAVFNAFGMDTCCGSAVPVREAARRDGVDLDILLGALRAALEAV